MPPWPALLLFLCSPSLANQNYARFSYEEVQDLGSLQRQAYPGLAPPQQFSFSQQSTGLNFGQADQLSRLLFSSIASGPQQQLQSAYRQPQPGQFFGPLPAPNPAPSSFGDFSASRLRLRVRFDHEGYEAWCREFAAFCRSPAFAVPPGACPFSLAKRRSLYAVEEKALHRWNQLFSPRPCQPLPTLPTPKERTAPAVRSGPFQSGNPFPSFFPSWPSALYPEPKKQSRPAVYPSRGPQPTQPPRGPSQTSRASQVSQFYTRSGSPRQVHRTSLASHLLLQQTPHVVAPQPTEAFAAQEEEEPSYLSQLRPQQRFPPQPRQALPPPAAPPAFGWPQQRRSFYQPTQRLEGASSWPKYRRSFAVPVQRGQGRDGQGLVLGQGPSLESILSNGSPVGASAAEAPARPGDQGRRGRRTERQTSPRRRRANAPQTSAHPGRGGGSEWTAFLADAAAAAPPAPPPGLRRSPRFRALRRPPLRKADSPLSHSGSSDLQSSINAILRRRIGTSE